MTTADEQVRVRAERARQIALFRYRLIQDVIDVRLSARQRGALVATIAGREHDGPFGETITVSRPTIDRWCRWWRAEGFAGLVPQPAQVHPRTPAEVLDMAAGLKRENLARTATQVARILRASTGWSPSERTLQRHFERLELHAPHRGDDRVSEQNDSMNTTAPPDTTGGAYLTVLSLTSNDAIPLTPNVAQHPCPAAHRRHRIVRLFPVDELILAAHRYSWAKKAAAFPEIHYASAAPGPRPPDPAAGPCACRKLRPCCSGGVLVFVDDAAETVVAARLRRSRCSRAATNRTVWRRTVRTAVYVTLAGAWSS